MLASISRMASTSRSRPVAIAGPSVSAPSRSPLSKLSPAWATAPRVGKPRNPALPLIEWTIRKTSERIVSSPGFCSSATRSRSSRFRFSWLSTRNSLMISSISETVGYGRRHQSQTDRSILATRRDFQREDVNRHRGLWRLVRVLPPGARQFRSVNALRESGPDGSDRVLELLWPEWLGQDGRCARLAECGQVVGVVLARDQQ